MAYLKYKKQKFYYKLRPLYEGLKVMNGAIAMHNLIEFKTIADEYNFKFQLGYGTLLGAIREHDFIAHDEDIDLVAEYSQLDVLMEMLPKLIECGFEIARWDDRGFISVIRDEEYIDIYLFREMTEKIMICCGEPIPRQFFDETSTITFNGCDFLIPTLYEKLMVFLYGDDWRVPVMCNDYAPSRIRRFKACLFTYIKYYVPNFLLKPYFNKKEKQMCNRYVNNGRIQQYM